MFCSVRVVRYSFGGGYYIGYDGEVFFGVEGKNRIGCLFWYWKCCILYFGG